MFRNILHIICGISIITVACNNGTPTSETKKESPVSNQPDTTGAPVEKDTPNTNYKPAFAGQTRIAGVHTTTPYEGKVLSSGLMNPWGIVQLPDGNFLITEKGGTMRIADANGQLSDKITGLPAVNSDGQGGLLGLTLDPDFSKNKMVYWVFSEKLKEGNLTAVAKGTLSADNKKIENATVIYHATPAHNSTLHYGGRILFDKSGYMVVSTGERSDIETRPLAQSLQAALGKIVRITKEGKPAPGNPFANDKNARPEIWSYGHRNVQGLAWHPETGDLWETEFGPRGGDEVNRVEPGKNYGWPTITYGIEYSGEKIGDAIQQKAGLEQPVYYWDPVVSPSGIVFYTGNEIPEWKNNLFICALNTPHIARLVITNNKVTGEERLLAADKERFRDITNGKDGALYAVTDSGKLYRIGKKK
ncbi:PQQ-dependent sugar dehydrogenase [Pseudoflavitalea sp. G-6-1-2]|uniref:PQQ-dependent sugar dehydrogenase n=1 Tax=Pseudoflavitalea sp. G-6-1-2 TaxID=2728841 RepID=UPI00146AAA84|nr:PQQ-dependent sugar dehydrogenase [Pseudoflavitalea sp. G-6-1-2]NML21996.1 PQQ-dependent sugar dehydrogenase [Pseudoflavitalea sp. G-6-1-2]